MSPTPIADNPEFGRLAVILAWISGFVDAVGYVLLDHIFTANMTGNTVLLGIDLAEGNWTEATRHAATIPLFILGAFIGATLLDGLLRTRFGRGIIFGLETIMIGGFWLIGWWYAEDPTGGWRYHVMLALLTVSMGMHTVVLPRVAGKVVRTTFVTGTLTSLAEEAATGLAGRSRDASAAQHRIVLAATWTAYLLGALAGGVAVRATGFTSVIFPVTLLAALALFDAGSSHAEKRGEDGRA
ncbi:hypothetical protein N825_21990 [Skermanella stibiiresistens SB22]|uniref:DUF1275 domain-containing protein n=1 Tax=Skermanella stibiiresistens SB22 TaxID=1385369 RepID=W9GZS1_9PROT|nr:YoaK family protein [Skermanella stibiiresistens]EWY36983.1 hypothetical protein N825_21990 [Skermanella stibiiresistens SB22]